MLKKSNKKVEELHQELQELNAHIVVKDPEELLGNERRTRWTLTKQPTNQARQTRPALYRIFTSVAKDSRCPSACCHLFQSVQLGLFFSTWIFGVQVVFPGFQSTLCWQNYQGSTSPDAQRSFGNSSSLFQQVTWFLCFCWPLWRIHPQFHDWNQSGATAATCHNIDINMYSSHALTAVWVFGF